MPAVKVVDCDGRQPRRRARLWECFGGLLGINPTNIKDGGNGNYYVIVPQEKIEHIISDESKRKLRDHQFEINTPIEYNAMRTVIVRHIDKVISEYSDQEIINNIEATNSWAKVEFVYKLTDTGRMLKIRFSTTEMAARAVRDGLVIAYQRIPSRYVEKEIFVKLTPCYNCYSYDHKTQACEMEKQSICAFCAKKGHSQNSCTESSPKCINCDGKHKTLASVCPVRKRIIKERSKDVRERSRSRSRARQVTYADSVNPQHQQQQQQKFFSPPTNANANVNVEGHNTKDLVAKIITSITFAHYYETLKPGSFQNTMDQMFKENNLPQVNFPANLIGKEFSNLLDKTQDNVNVNVNAAQSNEVINANNSVKSKVPNEMDLEFHNKRAREENSPVSSRKKREKETESERESEDERTYVVKPKSQRPELAPKPQPPQPQPLPQRDPRLAASAARACERERRRSGRSKERDEAREHTHTRSPTYVRIPEVNYANTAQVQLHFYVQDSTEIDLTTSNPDTYDQIKDAVINNTAKFHWYNPIYSYEKIYGALLNNNIDWGNVKLSKLSDDRVRAMKNEHCNF